MREKIFGHGRPRPLDREGKLRLMVMARGLRRRRLLTPKAIDVLEALLWVFHNARTGLCFPSYERIMERAGCARSTVNAALKALEACKILSWVQRILRVREEGRVRVVRTSNAYHFLEASKFEVRPGTTNQVLLLPAPVNPDSHLGRAIEALRKEVFRDSQRVSPRLA